MKFTVITPSFGQLGYLKLNAASVADQSADGIKVEHIIQDGGSTDGTREWLADQTGITGVAEADDGMYDAINRGIAKGSGDVFSWLNCDEQYLPGALNAVRELLESDSEIDVVVGHTVVVDEAGRYLCHRKAVVPSPGILRRGRLPVHSSSMFFRARLVKGPDAVLFDPQWKAMGDWAWMKDLVERGARVAVLDRFLSTFTDTGGNLGMSPRAQQEMRRVESGLSLLDRMVSPAVRAREYLGKLVSGYYRQAPFHFACYRPDPEEPGGVSERRHEAYVERPTFYWKGHMFGQ